MTVQVRIPGTLGVVLSEDQKRVLGLYSIRHAQESIYRDIYHLAPVRDTVPDHPMFPGRVERAPRHHRKTGRPKSQTATCHRDMTINKRTHHAWRPLSQCWPEHGVEVEVQVTRSGTNTGRFPNCYHIDKKWFRADTKEPLVDTVERWRMMPA